MVEKIRFGGEWTFKKILAAVLFGAIIIVFALWGLKPSGMGSEAGGVAAIVNDSTISLAEFKARSDQVEQNARGRFEGLPEAQRRQITSQLRQRVLEQLIVTEALYQAANKRGVIASDAEVKDQILSIPFLQENGRFLGDRYRMWLQNMNLSAEDFERQIRKDIVTQRLQELFAGSAAPSREEMRRNRLLSEQKVKLRFSQITRDEMKKFGLISDKDVAEYIPAHKAEIEAYYKENKIDFTAADKFRARDILIRIDDKRKEADALKLAEEVRKQATPKKFAQLAGKYSEDPGSKKAGGDLGERARGSLSAEFEEAAFALSPGQISQPLKLEGGVHVILLESKTPGGAAPLEKVQAEVARRMISRTRETEVMNKVRETVEKAERKDVDALFAKAGVKWQESGEFDLASPAIPKLGDAKEVMPLVIKQGAKGGLIRQLIPYQGAYLVVEVTGWREVPDKTGVGGSGAEVEGVERMAAYRKAEGAIESWAKDVEGQATIHRNTQLFR